jgi:hypothetical protein
LIQLIADCQFVNAATHTEGACAPSFSLQESNAAAKTLTSAWLLVSISSSGDAVFGEWDGAGFVVMRQTEVGSKVFFLQPLRSGMQRARLVHRPHKYSVQTQT